MRHRSQLLKVTLAVPAVVLAGCAGLPEHLVEQAESTATLIQAENERTDNLEKQFGDFQQSAEFATLQKYAERERWSASFTAARAKLNSAESIYTGEVLPLIERDSPYYADPIRSELLKIPPLLAGARNSAQEWTARRDFLVKVAKQSDQVMKDCEATLAGFKNAYPGLETRANEAKRNHSARAEDIDRLTAPLRALFDTSSEAAASAASEFKKLDSGGDADLAVLGDSCEKVRTNWDEFRKSDPGVQAMLAELDRGYSRTLMDMKVEYGLVIRRQSWDESYDYPRLHNTDFQISKVDAETFNHFMDVSGSVAKLSSGWLGTKFSLSYGVDRGRWQSLGIDPVRQWPGGDNAAEFWVEKSDSRYFHKYLVQENGKTTETDWTEVSADLYIGNLDNLGMDVEAKPFGSFESEKLTHAAPPGMAYVGNPHYGRWTSDGSGGSVWTWVGPYLFYRTLFGSPMSYGRNDWNSWSRDYRGSRPYYGGTASAPRWGSRSQTVQTSPKMRGSTFARSGGLRQAPSSVRGAGPSSRGGSFGASGK